MERTKRLSEAAREALEHTICRDNHAILPTGLERKLYQEVNEGMERAGGKWSRKQGAHLFPGNAKRAIEQLLLAETLPLRNPFDLFVTPDAVADLLVQSADIEWTDANVLEPQAGTGQIVRALLRARPEEDWYLTMVEIDPAHIDALCGMNQGVVHHADFLEWAKTCKERFDYIVMNPPFTSPQDPNAFIAHIEAAVPLLRPQYGRLVSIVPESFCTNQSKRHQVFRSLLERCNVHSGKLLSDAFRESGTTAQCHLIRLDAPRFEAVEATS